MSTFLHVGCGPNRKNVTTPAFRRDEWHEVRLDIDPVVQPDIVGSMTDMSQVPTGSMNAIFSSHNIEHLYAHEVPLALAEFVRVLTPDGFVVLTCPDLKSVCALVAADRLVEPAYESPSGPISPIDILFGHRQFMAAGNLFMAHRSGFTAKSLVATLRAHGFPMVAHLERPADFDLWVIASKRMRTPDEMRSLIVEHLPVRE